MSTEFPAGLDNFPVADPESMQDNEDYPHSRRHQDVADAVEEVEKVTLGPIIANVKGFGAQGDGATDDTDAIQEALDYVNNVVTEGWDGGTPGGGIVYLPPSVSAYMAADLTIYSNTTLMGAGRRSSVLKLLDGADSRLLSTPEDGEQRWFVTLRDFGVDGNAENNDGADVPLIDIRGVNEPIVDRVMVVKNYGDALRFGSASVYCILPKVNDFIVRGDPDVTVGSGLGFRAGSSDAQVRGADIGYCKNVAGVYLLGHHGGVFSDVNAWQCFYGFELDQSNRNRLSNCLSDYAERHGFRIYQVQALQVANCQARESGVETDDTYDGFHILGTSGIPCKDISLDNITAMGTGVGSPAGKTRYGLYVEDYVQDLRVGVHNLKRCNVGEYFQGPATNIARVEMQTLPRFIRKAADGAAKNNDTSYANDSELVLQVAPNSVYDVELKLIIDGPAAADMKIKFSLPAGASIDWSSHPTWTDTGTFFTSDAVTLAGGVILGTGAGTNRVALLKGTIVTGAAGGSARPQWAQVVATVGDTFVRAGSTMKLDKVG